MDAWDKLMTLKEQPELANAPGYELEELYAAGEPVAWFLLLMEQPQFEPPGDWWFELRNRAGLPWARLLAAQPRFETHCDWASVGRGELVKLAFLAPELFARKFPEGRWHDLYAFLTPHEIMSVLMEAPAADEHLAKLKVAAMFNQRTLNAHKKIKQLIDNGAPTPCRFSSIRYSRPAPEIKREMNKKW